METASWIGVAAAAVAATVAITRLVVGYMEKRDRWRHEERMRWFFGGRDDS